MPLTVMTVQETYIAHMTYHEHFIKQGHGQYDIDNDAFAFASAMT